MKSLALALPLFLAACTVHQYAESTSLVTKTGNTATYTARWSVDKIVVIRDAGSRATVWTDTVPAWREFAFDTTKGTVSIGGKPVATVPPAAEYEVDSYQAW